MDSSDTPRTLGELVDALIEAEKTGRDFHLAMLESFIHIPCVAEIWRELMLEEAVHLHRLVDFRANMLFEVGIQPVDPATIEQARHVPNILGESRLRAIDTLEDAFSLLTEYEQCSHHRMTELLVEAAAPDSQPLFSEHPRPPHGPSRLAHILKRMGGSEIIKFIQSLRPGSARQSGHPRRAFT